MALDLDFNSEQELLRETVRGMCAQHATLSVVRELEDDPVGVADELWKQLGELGLCGLMSSESGMDLVDGIILYEELGRALAPVPHFVSCVLAAGVLVETGAQPELLARLVAGEAVATVGWLEPDSGFKAQGVQLSATADGGCWVLNGVKSHVLFGAAADVVVVLARIGNGIELFVVQADAEGLSYEQQMSLSSDTQYRVEFRNVVGDALVCSSGWEVWHKVMHPAAILAAAQAVGGAEYALELAVEYAKTRRQFDKALAEFQSISHYLADAKTALDGARMLVQEAAWAYSAGRDVGRLAPMAKLNACQVFRDVTAMAQQVFGGIGFTLDADIQLYFRRAKQLQLSWWDSRTCEDLISAAVLD